MAEKITEDFDQKPKGKDDEMKLPTREENFSEWYNQVVRRAGLADYSGIRGCMVIKPYGYALWEAMRDALDRRFKATGHENAYFPLFVPESYFAKEAEHVEGFAPEVAWVTHGGNEPLEERLAIRPTSEAIICSIYAKWVQSYRDLPLLINQWANVVRWEKRTRLFLRTAEFLWQEGHTVHRTEEEARRETLQMLEVYRDFAEMEMAMPVVPGRKTDSEKFAGAVDTFCIEALMQDGLALQAGTSHFLGQNFARVFEIKFLDQDNTEKFAWQTSWGVSTRLVGGLVMAHGDDKGLMLPPRLAPKQVVLVPIFKSDDVNAQIIEKIQRIAADLRAAGVRCETDLRDTFSPGWKFNEWEMKGVPLRIEVGPKDVQKGSVVIARRDTREKAFVPDAEVVERVRGLLDAVQKSLFERAKSFREASTRRPATYAEFKEMLDSKRGFLECGWDGTAETELAIKEETKATIRCLPLAGQVPPEAFAAGSGVDLAKVAAVRSAEPGEKDIFSGKPAVHRVLYARAY